MLKHKKFVNEKICDGCRCNFFPEKGYEEVQKNCRGCAELPEIPIQENEPEQENTKNCKKCGNKFTPKTAANTICENCK